MITEGHLGNQRPNSFRKGDWDTAFGPEIAHCAIPYA